MLNKQWEAELIYPLQMQKSSKDLNPEWADHIFRLNMKWAIPNKKNMVYHNDQLDMDE